MRLAKFARQVERARWVWLGVITLALIASIVTDLATDHWDSAPFLTDIVSSLLLLGLTVLLIDEYLSFRAARTWEPIAAFALEDLGRAARAAWVRSASFILPRYEPMGVVQFRR